MTAPQTSVQQGRQAIRERNFSSAIQLLRRAYRQDPSADNALWLASAYTEAGYAQLAALYKEIYQERTGKAPELILSSPPPAAPQSRQSAPPPPRAQPSSPQKPSQTPTPPTPISAPPPLPPRHPVSPPLPPPLPPQPPRPLPQPLAKQPPPQSPTPISWNYTPAPIEPDSLTQTCSESPRPTPDPTPPPSPYLPVRHAPDLSQPETGTPLSRRLDSLHRQFKDRVSPYIAEIALQLAEAYDEQENYKEAQRYYREVLDLDRSLTLRPMVLERLEEIRILQSDTLTPGVHRLLEMADQQRELGNLQMAENLYRQLLRTDAPLSVHNAARKGLIRLYPDGKA